MLWLIVIYLTEMCFKLHMYKYKYIVVKECYTYSFVMSVDHYLCGNENQFEK